MKARLPVKSRLTKKMNKDIKEQSAIVVRELIARDTQKIVRRTLKMFCVALNREFGFGKTRLNKVLATYFSLMEKEDEETFAQHLDRAAIDELGLKFEREQEE